jgi:hypothetical protein
MFPNVLAFPFCFHTFIFMPVHFPLSAFHVHCLFFVSFQSSSCPFPSYPSISVLFSWDSFFIFFQILSFPVLSCHFLPFPFVSLYFMSFPVVSFHLMSSGSLPSTSIHFRSFHLISWQFFYSLEFPFISV